MREPRYLGRMRFLLCSLAVATVLPVLATVPLHAQEPVRAASTSPNAIAIIPQPVQLTTRAGSYVITGRTVIWADARSAPVARQLARYLEPATGFTFNVRTGGTPPSGAIVLRHDASLRRLG